jgi:hypothetical protein
MKSKMLIMAAAATVAIMATPAGHASSSPKAKADGDRMVCKYRQETGTRFKKKTCMTAAQWEEMANNHQAGLKETVDRPKILICGPQTGC